MSNAETATLEAWTPEQCADYVNEPLRQGAAKFIEAGHRLHEAKSKCVHGGWMAAIALTMVDQTTANTLMRVAMSPEIVGNALNLPSELTTLKALASLPQGKITELVESGEITSRTSRKDAKSLVSRVREALGAKRLKSSQEGSAGRTGATVVEAKPEPDEDDEKPPLSNCDGTIQPATTLIHQLKALREIVRTFELSARDKIQVAKLAEEIIKEMNK